MVGSIRDVLSWYRRDFAGRRLAMGFREIQPVIIVSLCCEWAMFQLRYAFETNSKRMRGVRETVRGTIHERQGKAIYIISVRLALWFHR
jgi:hypothetical protein